MQLLTAAPADDNTPGCKPEVPSTPTAGDAASIMPPTAHASPDPMHATRARDVGMDRALFATSPEDRAAITAAILRGMDTSEPRRAEDALTRANFTWPPAAKPRSLGAIMSHLSRAGLIRETSWTKGRHGRSHAGRVSLWVRATP
jgi:hypothetical protein